MPVSNEAKVTDLLTAPAASESERKPRRVRSLKQAHRLLEQDDQEPLSTVLFKWVLIVMGLIMLGAVLYLMGEVIYAWSTGTIDTISKSRRRYLSVVNATRLKAAKTGAAPTAADVDFVDFAAFTPAPEEAGVEAGADIPPAAGDGNGTLSRT